MSTDQAFCEMLKKNTPTHDSNKESDQAGPAYKKVRSFPETFETSTRAQGKRRTLARQQQRRTIATERALYLSRGR